MSVSVKKRATRDALKAVLSKDEGNYHNDGNIHYSLLKSFEKDPKVLDPNYEEPDLGRFVLLGNAFDLATENINEFRNQYKVATKPVPTHTLGKLAEILIDDDEVSLTDHEAIVEICNDHELWKSHKSTQKDPYKRERLLAIEYGKPILVDYVEEQRLLKKWDQDKVLELSEYNDIQSKAMAMTDQVAKRYINPGDDVQYLFQPVYRFEYQGEQISVKYDLLVVNYTQRIIISYDFKYYGSGKMTRQWKNYFWMYRYDIQAYLYTMGLVDLLPKVADHKDWKVMSIQFAVACPNDDRIRFFGINSELLQTSKNGWTTPTGHSIRGVDKLIEDTRWHLDNKEYEYEREYIENQYTDTIQVPK